jgi:hypothetical protein
MKTGGPPCTFTISLTECPGLVDHYRSLMLLSCLVSTAQIFRVGVILSLTEPCMKHGGSFMWE